MSGAARGKATSARRRRLLRPTTCCCMVNIIMDIIILPDVELGGTGVPGRRATVVRGANSITKGFSSATAHNHKTFSTTAARGACSTLSRLRSTADAPEEWRKFDSGPCCDNCQSVLRLG